MPAFDDEAFRCAAELVRERGGFTAGMLKEKPVRDVIRHTYNVLQKAISESITQSTPGELTAALENNAFVFSGFKTYHSLKEVGLSLVDDKGNVRPFDKFYDDVAKINERYNHNWLQAEYHHAVAASQMAVRWHDFEQDGDRYDLQYRTAGDNRVREEHAALADTTLPPDDTFWNSFMPPNGWNCRCTVVQVRKGKYLRSDSEKAMRLGEDMTKEPKKMMFRFNPGKELRLFPAKHPYLKAPEEVKGLVDITAMRARSKEIRAEAKSLVGTSFFNSDFKKSITITNAGIKEWLNQPHKLIKAKNEMLLRMPEIIKASRYIGQGEDKHNPAITIHVFEVVIENEKSWIVVREFPFGESCYIHSISDGQGILRHIKKPFKK